MGCRNDETILVVGDRHYLIHLINGATRKADICRDTLIEPTIHRFRSHIAAHGEHTLERQCYRLLITGGKEIGEILKWDAQ